MDAFQALLRLVLDPSSLTQIQQQINGRNLQANVRVNTAGAQSEINNLESSLTRISRANTMQGWANSNTVAMKKFGAEVNQLIARMNSATPLSKAESAQITQRFKQIQFEAKKTGDVGQTALGKFGAQFKSYTRYFVAMSLVMAPIQAMRSAIDMMKEVDSELVNIQKVTGATAEKMRELTKEAYAMATAYGRTPTEFLKSVTAFSRAGYGEAASELGELSMLAQNVGDINEEIADGFLLSADAAWKYGGDIDSLRRILDGFNELSNKTATDVQKLAEGIQVSGSIFAQAGLSAQDYAGIIGTATAKTQLSGNEMSRAWRTILMNINQVKGRYCPYVQKCA